MSTNPKSDMRKQPSGQLCQPSQSVDPSQTLGEQCLLAATPCSRAAVRFLRAAAGPQGIAGPPNGSRGSAQIPGSAAPMNPLQKQGPQSNVTTQSRPESGNLFSLVTQQDDAYLRLRLQIL